MGVRRGGAVHSLLAVWFNGVPMHVFPYVHLVPATRTLKQRAMRYYGRIVSMTDEQKEQRWALEKAANIVEFGSWRSYRASLRVAANAKTAAGMVVYQAWCAAHGRDAVVDNLDATFTDYPTEDEDAVGSESDEE